jgi:hypothetical protein
MPGQYYSRIGTWREEAAHKEKKGEVTAQGK